MMILHPALRRAAHKRTRYSVRPFYVTLVVFVIIATSTWVLRSIEDGPSQALHVAKRQPAAGVSLFRRDDEPECRLVRSVKDQCAFVRANCPELEDGLFSYLQFYYCALTDAKPVAFIILILWLSLLFSTIGIAASDFLCIDLSTLASVLGLSESLTGVTFLAFGNGSPDVFSTFAAMRSNSGSLAVGELLGAATFITSVVAGSMALVRPFKVARRSFVRDVGYFVVAVSFSMFLLADGRLHVWESAAMVALYVFYVVMVVSWHWCLVRRRRKYERDLAARTHFNIPENQELEIEQPMEDDDPSVAPESRSQVHGALSEDFDLLERAEGLPLWKEEDEDEDTRNHYLAEIRDNMHVYRPANLPRRNTMNPIRPSLVGALEFQSVLHSLQKSRDIRRNPAVSISSYSDAGDATSQPFDTLSVASHPRASRSTANDHLSPPSAGGSPRTRAVSANAADGLKLDTSRVLGRSAQGPRLTVSRPSTDGAIGQEAMRPPQLPRVDTVVTEDQLSSRSPEGDGISQMPQLLAPPETFHSPNYQAGATRSRSPQSVSPRTGASNQEPVDLESTSVPFPSYTDIPSSGSSRSPSIRFANLTSPIERLQIHDSFHDASQQNHLFSKSLDTWWPGSIPSPPQQIWCILFPTLAGWRSKNIWDRLLGLVAAPSVFLLTITVPVVEPEAPDSPEPEGFPSVVVEQVNDGNNPAPRVRLPSDSPVMHPGHREHDSGPAPELASAHSHHKYTHQEHTSRPRWDSELPPAALTPLAAPQAPAKDWNRWLVAIQLFTGPFFIVLIGWTAMDETLQPVNLLLPSLVCLLFSSLCITALVISTRHRPWHEAPNANNSTCTQLRPLPSHWRPFLSLLGFLVAISWIATIATEVVALLKTLGVILNISDSLLGLTVFAVGNSLGDLVADITIARLGYPVMALSACFGGPMLNILLGIGLGGLYMTLKGNGSHHRPHEAFQTPGIAPVRVPYEIAISKVLVISGATLLVVLVGLLIVVPLNNWRMDRKIGWGLVVLWCVSTLGNVIAEVTS